MIRSSRDSTAQFYYLKDRPLIFRKIESGSHGKRRSDIEGSRDGLSEIDSMHHKCSGHIHRAPKSRDLKDSTPARFSFSGKRCFFLRQMREICLAAEFREARSRFPDEYFRFQYLQRCGNRIFDRGTYIHLRHHVSTRRCEKRSTMMRLIYHRKKILPIHIIR